MKTLTLSELSEHDGSSPDKPMYLAIRGTVFDVTLGEQSDVGNTALQCLVRVLTCQLFTPYSHDALTLRTIKNF